MAGEFDIEGARQSGYGDAEIADFLAREQSFDLKGARAAGYQDSEIVGSLAKRPRTVSAEELAVSSEPYREMRPLRRERPVEQPREAGAPGTKGLGYFGPLKRPDGGVSTELSFDFDENGKKVFAPLLVPTLEQPEIDHLLSGGSPTDVHYRKATEHARQRIAAGKDPFSGPGEQGAAWGDVAKSLPGQFVGSARQAGANLRRMGAEERLQQGWMVDSPGFNETAGGAATGLVQRSAVARRSSQATQAAADAAKAAEDAAQAKTDVELVTPRNMSIPQKAVSSLAQSAAPTLAGIGVGILTRNPWLAMSIAGGGGSALQGASTYGEALEKGATHRQASVAATIDGVLEGVGEALPLAIALKPGTPIFARIFNTMMAEAGQEAATQTAQDLHAYLSWNPNITLKEAWENLQVATLAGGMGGAIYGGAGHLADQGRKEPVPVVSGQTREALASAIAKREAADAALAGGLPVRGPDKPAPGSFADLKRAVEEDVDKPLSETRKEDAQATREKAVVEEEQAKSYFQRELEAQFDEIERQQKAAAAAQPPAVEAAPERDGTPESPVIVTAPEDLERAGERVKTDLTDKEKESGIYPKAHVDLQGLKISIENPKGSERSGVDADGERWAVVMPSAYGYIKRTDGADGEQVDVYVGDVPASRQVWVVDQIDPKTGNFDEHKALLGFPTAIEARRTYVAGFSDGSGESRIGAITHMGMDQFKDWLKTADTVKPVAYVKQKPVVAPAQPQGEQHAAEIRKGTEGAQPERPGNAPQVQADREDRGERSGEHGQGNVAGERDSLQGGREQGRGTETRAPGTEQGAQVGGRQDAAEARAAQENANVRAGNQPVSRPAAGQEPAVPAEAVAPETKRPVTPQVPAMPGTAPLGKRGRPSFAIDEISPPEALAPYGQSNKVFTQSAAEAARERLRKKLGQINIGVDPEMMQDGVTLAGYHIEAGARTFAAFTKAMVADLGEKIRPYLKGLYLAVRNWPGLDNAGMQTEAQIEKEAADELQLQPTGISGPSAPALERVPADQVPGTEGERPAPSGPRIGGRPDVTSDGGRPGGGVQPVRGMGEEPGTVPAAAGGKGPAAGEDAGQPGVQRPGRTEPTPGRAGAGGLKPGEIVPVAGNFVITDEIELGKGGPVQKYNDNVAAIKLLKEIEDDGRKATLDEQKILARYVGWGGLKQAFPRPGAAPAKGWEKRVAEIRDLLTSEEYEAAASSIQNAHYTSKAIVDGIWGIAQHLGFDGGRVSEFSMGTGNFFGLMPAALRAESSLTGVERDSITARIAKQLYPQANILGPVSFEDTIFSDETFNLNVGNPPFGKESPYDPNSRHLKGFSIHNFFFSKAIDKLAPGGLHIQVVSRYLMDAQNTGGAREYIAHRARLVGAIRLPWTAFYENARTEVVTDIVILQKLPRDEWGTSDQSWTETTEIPDPLGGEPMRINRYFDAHPDMILGTMNRSGEQMHENDITVQPDESAPLVLQIAKAAMNLPADIYARGKTEAQINAEQDAAVAPEDVIERYSIDSYFEDGGKLFQRVARDDGSLAAAEVTESSIWKSHEGEKTPEGAAKKSTPWGSDRISRVRGMVRIRDAETALLKAERADSELAEIDTLREKLNRTYDAYVKQWGYLNEQTNELAFRADPDAPKLLALEGEFDRGVTPHRAKTLGVPARKPSAKKMPIFSQRVVNPYSVPTSADTPADGLAISIAEKGYVSIPYIVSLTGKPEAEVVEALTSGEKPAVYLNPETDGYETASDYLSGNVKAKHAAARAAGLYDQAERLKAVFPPDVSAGDIRARLGAPWIDAGVYERFFNHLLGEDAEAVVKFIPATGGFAVSSKGGDPTMIGIKWGATYLTDAGSTAHSRDAHDLIARILNNKDLTVYHTDTNGDRFTIKEESLALADKAAEIKNEFEEWVFKDNEQREALVAFYNENLNTNVKTVFDGAYLTLPGKVPDAVIQLRRHQNDAIARIIRKGKALLDHVVGSGKSFTIAGAVMELRRLGLAKKPMLVVPNHLVEQWATEFYRLYPGARVLAMRKNDFSKKNRQRMLARVATGDWDAVIFAHSSFGFIENDRDVLKAAINKQIAEIQSAIDAARATEGKRSRTAAQYQKQKDKLQARLKALLDKPKDKLFTFQELGVDMVIVDESQEFKNLYFTTQRRGTGGFGNPTGSKRAFDLFIKTQWLQQTQKGRGVVFASGTPVSNSLTELFTLQRYLGLEQLERTGMVSLDAWLSSFGMIETEYESNVAGTAYKRKERLRRITNAPEILQHYAEFSDSVTQEQVNKNYREDHNGEEFPIPKVKGGKPRDNVVAPRSELQAAYSASLQERIDNLPRDQRVDNALKVLTDGRKAALDMRLVDPAAPDHPGSKVHVAADNIARIYNDNTPRLGTQLVFLDLSTPAKHGKRDAARYLKVARELLGDPGAAPLGDMRSQWADLRHMLEERMATVDEQTATSNDQESDKNSIEAIEKFLDQRDDIEAAVTTADTNFSVYDDLRSKLIERGVPAAEIAFIHDYNGDVRKQDLFDMVNAGTIRVLLGSTAKMGAGTNVQRKAVGLHHLDVPWRPSDIEQREGRIVRQGNEFRLADPAFEVEILAYATEGTSDVFFWQTQEQKLIAINSLRNYKGEREIENVSADSMSAAEMKALASGNPLILEDVQLTESIRKLESQRRRHMASEQDMQSQAVRYQRYIEQLPALIERQAAAVEKMDAYDREPFAGAERPTIDVDGKAMNATEAREHIKQVATSAQEVADKANEPLRAQLQELQKQAVSLKPGSKEFSDLETQYSALQKTEIKPKFSVKIGDKDYGNAETARRAIVDQAGDTEPFRVVIDGKDFIRRRDVAAHLDPIIAELSKAEEGKRTIGTIGGMGVSIEWVAQKYATGIELTIGGEKTFIEQQVSFDRASGVKTTIPLTGERVVSGIARLFNETRQELAGNRRSLDQAQKGLEPLKAQLGKPWGKDLELDSKRTRLAEVRGILSEPAAKHAVGEPAGFSDRYLANEDEVVRGITELARQISPQVKVDIINSMFLVTEEGGRQEVAGRRIAAENLIEVALRYEDPLATLRHEAVHSFFDMGLLSGAEQNALKARAPAWRTEYDIDTRYKHLAGNEVALNEEGMADAYKEWGSGKRFGGFIGPAFAKIKRFLQGLGDILRSNGFVKLSDIFPDLTAKDVFARMESGEVGRRPVKASTKPAETKLSVGEAPEEPLTTRRNGVDDILPAGGREQMPPAQATIDHAKRVFDDAGLAVVPRGTGLWDVADKTVEAGALDDAGHRLLEALRREIRALNSGTNSPETLSSLINSVREYIASDENRGISSTLRTKLYGVAQGEASHRGLMLGALAQTAPDSLQRLARNIEGALERVYAEQFGGNGWGAGQDQGSGAISGTQDILDDVLKSVRDQFTPEELAKLADASPELMKWIEKMSSEAMERDLGGRLYRKIQWLYKDKKAKSIDAMAEDARVNEAAQKIIEDLKQFGIEPKPRPGKKSLTALESLILMVSPETSEAIDNRIGQAISEAERNAGIAASLEDAKPDERALMQEAFRQGLEPTAEMVEKGMQADNFRHWRILRDNLLGYSPTTMKLVQQVIRGEFKGTKFGQPAPKAPDTRIDINKLAKAPSDEVHRVLDNSIAAIEAEMDLAGATDETRLRVGAMLQATVESQLAAARKRVRDRALVPPAAPGAKLTAEQHLRELFNAGLLGDPRMTDAQVVARVAQKSMVRSFVPNLRDMMKKVFETPFYRQSELEGRFGRAMAETFNLTGQDRARAETLFRKAYADQFSKAKARALDQVKKSLTPKQQKTVRRVPTLWEKIEAAVNAGAFDSSRVMQDIARARGWTIPTPVDLAEIRTLAENEQRLRELTPAERAEAERKVAEGKGSIADYERDKAAATISERAHLKREMQALWLRWTAPLGWRTVEGRRNVARAVNEATSANLLLRPGFFVRQLIDVMTQNAVYTPTRAAQEAFRRYQADKVVAGRETRLWRDVGQALHDAYVQRAKALRAALAATRRGLAGRSETKNVEQILDNISIFDRAELKADELAAQGKTAQAFMVRLTNHFAFAFRYAKALDELQGVLAEAQEMHARTITELREHGLTPEQASESAEWVMSDTKAEFVLALARAEQILTSNGVEATPAQLEQAAWDVVKSRQYGRIEALQIDAEDFQGENRMLRNVIGWNEREMGGLGGVVAGFGRAITQLSEQVGVPMPLARFSNAIGISINRVLTFTPLGFFSSAFKGSAWYRTERDITQRKIEAAAGTSVGLVLWMLVLAGVLVPRFKWPDDEAERQVWSKIGRQPGTVEIMIGGGKYITISMTVGPFSLVRPWLVFAGSLKQSAEKHEEKARKLARRAEESGLQPAMVEQKSADALYAAYLAAFSAFLGGRTAVGIISNLTDYRTPQPERATAGVISPLIPGSPQAQEISRMMGVQLDPKRAGVLDFLFPVAGTEVEKRNFFYDPLNEQTTERIVKVLTGGTWPLATLPIHKDTEAAYRVLYETGWRPGIVQNQARQIGRQLRAFDPQELERYRELRGRELKQLISANADRVASQKTEVAKYGILDSIQEAVNEKAEALTIKEILDRSQRTGASQKIPLLKPRAPMEIRP